MCGIFGIFRPNRSDIDEAAFLKMGEFLQRRGPDHTGTHIGPGIAVGNTRLSIVDLATGNQPIFNEDRRLAIVYNGEIYNHRDIRRDLEKHGHRFSTNSDTETVLHAYEQYGPKCLDLFNGMFAFAVYDFSNHGLFVARDRLGIKPLYWAHINGAFCFASESKALLHLLPGGPQPDWTAIYRYLSFGYVPAPESPFVGIRKFPAGSYGRPDNQGIQPVEYWHPAYGTDSLTTPEQANQTAFELLDKAVELELMSDVPLGVLLSGGLDSSAVALLAKEKIGNRLKTFSLRFEESTHDESQDARLVADHLGTDHYELRFTRERMREYILKTAQVLDEPFGDSTVLPLYALSDFAREQVKVVLTGWGGDEILAGYQTYQAHRLARHYRRLPLFITDRLVPLLLNFWPVSDKYMNFGFKARRFSSGTTESPEIQHFIWMNYLNDTEKNRILTHGALSKVQGGTWDPVIDEVRRLNESELISRIMHLDARFFLEGNGLFQADRMTMAASLEARVPLLNIDLISYLNSLPTHIKMPGGRLKGFFRQMLEGRLPDRIINKPKKGFGPPSSIWVRDVVDDLLDCVLDSKRLRDDGVLNPLEIRRLLDEHRSRRADHGRSLWALFSFQLWYDRFIVGRRSFEHVM
jgi:asparagine synthase (glutamine-hydrolysing)